MQNQPTTANRWHTRLLARYQTEGKYCVTAVQTYQVHNSSASAIHAIGPCKTDSKGELLLSLEHIHWLHLLTSRLFYVPPVLRHLLTSSYGQDSQMSVIQHMPGTCTFDRVDIRGIRIFLVLFRVSPACGCIMSAWSGW